MLPPTSTTSTLIRKVPSALVARRQLSTLGRRPVLPVVIGAKGSNYATIAPTFPGNGAAASTSSTSATGTGVSSEGAKKVALPSLSNIEASWKQLAPAEQEAVFRHLEELQKKDWKELSNQEKRAAYYVAYGPHGPREPNPAPGQTMRSVVGLAGVLGVGTVAFFLSRAAGGDAPRTFQKEYQEAMTQRSKDLKMDPFTGPGSEGYKGTGFIQSVPGLNVRPEKSE